MAALDEFYRAEITATRLVRGMGEKGLTLALAESCTAGLIAELIGRVSGASRVLWGSFVCYSPDAKQKMLGIDGPFLKRYGLVSRETACEMAVRALETAGVSIAAAVTGVAGPFGDGGGMPIGTVWTAIALKEDILRAVGGNTAGGSTAGGDNGTAHRETEHYFRGERKSVQMQAAVEVLEELLEFIQSDGLTK